MSQSIKPSAINWLIAVPLMVMSYHIYLFYESEPAVIRVALALSFDLLVVVVFYFLKDEHIAGSTQARRVTWWTLWVMIAFQLYVNVWAYWDLGWLRGFVSGAIFPAVVGLVSYVSMLREKELERKRRLAAGRAERDEEAFGIVDAADLALLAEERPFEGERLDKALVIRAYKEDQSELSRDRFLGASNWRSVKRWWDKLNEGERL